MGLGTSDGGRGWLPRVKVAKSIADGAERGSYGGDGAGARWKERAPLAIFDRTSWQALRCRGEMKRSQSKKFLAHVQFRPDLSPPAVF